MIRSIKTDSALIYALGVFYNKPDALKYLEYVKRNGFTKAYIVNQYDLASESEKMALILLPIRQAVSYIQFS